VILNVGSGRQPREFFTGIPSFLLLENLLNSEAAEFQLGCCSVEECFCSIKTKKIVICKPRSKKVLKFFENLEKRRLK